MRIELVGGLGIGKSTLCRTLESIGFNCIYENLKTNPFLADCFEQPEAFRFPSQMWFVLSKFHEIRKFEKPGAVNVLDQAVLNVRAYTNLLFGEEDPAAKKLIDDCFAYMERQIGPPDLLINLVCSPAEQMRRIRNRDRGHEKGISLEDIELLQDEMNRLVAAAKADGHAVLHIDTESVYLPENAEYARRLARQVADMFDLDLNQLTGVSDRSPLLRYAETVGRAA